MLMAAALALPASVFGQPALQVLDQSQFWIEGSSTVNQFTCRVDVVSGHGPMPTQAASVQTAEARAADTTGVTIPVQRFDCGNNRMSEDLKETLKAQAHPRIRFTLHDATVRELSNAPDGWAPIEALGFLTVAGTERLVRVNAWGRSLGDGRYRVRGCKPLKMTYFGIDPPTKFFGAVKVHNQIEVHFDLLAQAARQSAPDSSVFALTDDPPPCHE